MPPSRKVPDSATITLEVNGEPVRVAFAPHKTLLEVRGEVYMRHDEFEAINAEIGPYREAYFALRGDPERMEAILAHGAAKARHVAREVLNRARERCGYQPMDGAR